MEISLFESITFDRFALVVESLEIGDQYITLLQGPLDGFLCRLTIPQFRQLLIELVVRDLMDDAAQFKAVCVVEFDLGPDIETCGKSQRLAGLVIELRDSRGACRVESGLLGRLLQQSRQQIFNDATADSGAVAFLDEIQRHLPLSESGDFKALLMCAQGGGHFLGHALGRNLDLEVTFPLAGFDEIGLH